MVWDEDWNPAQYAPEAADKGSGEAWERLNNQLFLEWQRFNVRLELHAEEREQAKRPIDGAERATHVARFRELLNRRYGRSGVDQRWEVERIKRLEARERPSGKRDYAA